MFMDMSLSCDTIANTQTEPSPVRNHMYYTPERTHSNSQISDSTGAAWLLGREYYLPQEKPEFHSDVNSLLWFSYRKGFKPIGGSGNLKSDTGWGCCYRCGQMLMGHSLIRNALGRDWKWRVQENGVEDMNPHYPVILAEFLDTNTACYSIHQLTSQAVDFGRDLGTWAGPNTVAQALRCRAKSDPLCNIVVHVAMDMLVIRQNIKKECQMPGLRLAEDAQVEVEPLFSPRQFSLSSPMQPTNQISKPAAATPTNCDVSKFETHLSQSTLVLGGYEHDPESDEWREIAPYPLAPTAPQNSTKNNPKTFQNLQNRISQSKHFSILSNIFKTEKMPKNSNSKVAFSQSLGKVHSPFRGDITRRMSEPLNMRVNTNVNNINKEFVLVSKSSREQRECFNDVMDDLVNNNNNKPTKLQESFQVLSIKPSPKIDTTLPPLESIGAPPEIVSSCEAQIDTSVSSCVFVSDLHTTMDISDISEADPSNLFRPLLLLIPLRLGQDKFNLEYARPLMSCFKLPQSVGIIGGRPKHALYLIGYQDEHIFYLDPHTTQSTVTTPHGSVHIPDKTFHTNHVESMHFSELDPSLAIGFFCETEAVFEDLLDQLETHVLSQKPKLFEISDSVPFIFNRPNSIGTNTKQEPFSLVDKDDILNDVIDLALDEDIDDWDIIPEQFS